MGRKKRLYKLAGLDTGVSKEVAVEKPVSHTKGRKATKVAPVKELPVAKTPGPVNKEHEKVQAEEWEKIPGVSEGKPPVLGTLGQSSLEWREWAAKYKLLDHAPEHIKKASYTLSKASGFVPDSKDWIAAMTMLWGACGGSEKVLDQAITKGEDARRNPKFPLTFKGPRSYAVYAKDIVALNNAPRVIDGNQPRDVPKRGAVQDNGWYKDSSGSWSNSRPKHRTPVREDEEDDLPQLQSSGGRFDSNGSWITS